MEIFRRSCFVLGGYHPGGEKKKKKKIEAITNTSMAVAGNCLLCENCWKKKKFFFARAIRTDLSTNFRSLFFPFSSRCDIVALFWESETLEFVYLFIFSIVDCRGIFTMELFLFSDDCIELFWNCTEKEYFIAFLICLHPLVIGNRNWNSLAEFIYL